MVFVKYTHTNVWEIPLYIQGDISCAENILRRTLEKIKYELTIKNEYYKKK